MQTKKVTHKITEDYNVIEYQRTDNGNVNDVYFRVSYHEDNEYDVTFATLQEAIDYINNLTFK